MTDDVRYESRSSPRLCQRRGNPRRQQSRKDRCGAALIELDQIAMAADAYKDNRGTWEIVQTAIKKATGV